MVLANHAEITRGPISKRMSVRHLYALIEGASFYQELNGRDAQTGQELMKSAESADQMHANKEERDCKRMVLALLAVTTKQLP